MRPENRAGDFDTLALTPVEAVRLVNVAQRQCRLTVVLPNCEKTLNYYQNHSEAKRSTGAASKIQEEQDNGPYPELYTFSVHYRPK